MEERPNQANDFYVYEHLKRGTADVFYVGKGRKQRCFSKSGRSIYWNSVVEKHGGFDIVFVGKGLTEEDSFSLEKSRIAYLRSIGIQLCNLTDGGEGPSGIVPTEEHKMKISKTKTGVKRSQETIKKMSESKTIKMIGLRFGRLIVTGQVGESKTGRHKNFLCKCDCGNEVVRSAIAIRFGREPSCGCSTRDFQRKKYDLSGKRFGMLTVIKPTEKSNRKRNINWICQCDCGNEKEVSGSELRKGQQSCGCQRGFRKNGKQI